MSFNKVSVKEESIQREVSTIPSLCFLSFVSYIHQRGNSNNDNNNDIVFILEHKK